MPVETVAGTTIAISAGIPGTFTPTGYAALTYSVVGEITDGGSHGRVYAEVTHQPIGNRSTQKFKGSFNEGNKTLQMAINGTDAGQVILNTALLSDAPFAFKVTTQGGGIDYFQARVMSFSKATAGVDSIFSATAELSITTSVTGVGIVSAP